MPSTGYDVKGLLKSSIRDEDPVIFIEHKGLYRMKVEISEEEYIIHLEWQISNAKVKMSPW
jgi:pyruvate/2-oxoglutarate/acetoin dehydrogenase E1 component